MRAAIRRELESINPLDALERQHRSEALAWVDSGAPLFRTAKPATPPQHLVSYFAVIDGDSILLVDHKNAQLWLPPGGHVEVDEHPRDTVGREVREELGFTPAHAIEAPLMVTCTTTVTVRKAEERDLASVLALYRELRPHDPVLAPGVAREAFATLLARRDVHLVVCEAEGTLAATCMLAIIPNLASGARPFGVIEHVVTLLVHRKRGFAHLVLEHALEKAWSAGCYKVILLSGVRRTEAHKLYESVGFVGDVERGFVAKPPNAV